jgi:translation initiation factor 1A
MRHEETHDEEIIRVRLPKQGEVLGMITQRLGYCKMYVRCADGKIRLCRIPGKYTRRLWVREGDIVIAKPWEVQTDKRGDIIYKYTKGQVGWLKRHDHLKNLEEEF